MKSMMLSDLYNLQSFGKQMLFSFLIITACMLPNAGLGGYVCYCTVLFAMLVVSLLSIDERTNWQKYAFIMPVSKKDYIISKYIMSLILVLSGLCISFLIAYIGYRLGIVKKMPVNELKQYLIISLIIASVFVSIYIPILIRFGTEKARFIFIGLLLLPGGIVGLVALDSKPPVKLIQSVERAACFLEIHWYLAVLVWIAIIYLSIRSSIRAIERKEF